MPLQARDTLTGILVSDQAGIVAETVDRARPTQAAGVIRLTVAVSFWIVNRFHEKLMLTWYSLQKSKPNTIGV